MLEAKQSGNVVEDFTIGNTRIKICDDFCRTRTSGEVKEILDRVARRTVGSLTAAATPDYGCAYSRKHFGGVAYCRDCQRNHTWRK